MGKDIAGYDILPSMSLSPSRSSDRSSFVNSRNPSTWNRLSRRGLSDKQADLTHSQLAVATSSSHIKGQCSHERLAASTPNVSNATGLMPEVPHKRLTDQARVQVELHLQKILNEFQTATAHLEDCGCADQSHSSHNLVNTSSPSSPNLT